VRASTDAMQAKNASDLNTLMNVSCLI